MKDLMNCKRLTFSGVVTLTKGTVVKIIPVYKPKPKRQYVAG